MFIWWERCVFATLKSIDLKPLSLLMFYVLNVTSNKSTSYQAIHLMEVITLSVGCWLGFTIRMWPIPFEECKGTKQFTWSCGGDLLHWIFFAHTHKKHDERLHTITRRQKKSLVQFNSPWRFHASLLSSLFLLHGCVFDIFTQIFIEVDSGGA